jgi:EAL domain-containing protein (putative c-di-GMP-specific phosphodiesterase class I)/GGDEF domain-containing protein
LKSGGLQPGGHGAEAPARLTALIRRREIAAYFQPIVCLQTGELVGFEALTRPGRASGYPGPKDLFDEAEACGMLWELESIIRETLLEHAAAFPDGISLFFNNSPPVFGDERFVEALRGQVQRYPELTPGRIVLEVTERGEGDSIDRLSLNVRELKALGYRVAIDDVGAGTSGLNRVMLLRPHWLKLDRALVEGVDQDPYRLNMIRFLLHFANLAGVSLVAEGIERREELGALIGAGVRYAQGYLLGRPAPGYQLVPEEIREYIRTTASRRAREGSEEEPARPLVQLAQSADTAQALTDVATLRADLMRDQQKPGYVIVDGQRCVGWCPRDVVMQAAAADPSSTVGFHTRAVGSTLPPNATLRQALELLSMRDDADLTSPIILADSSRITGTVSVRAVLSAAARDGHLWGARVHPITGLPGRIAADTRLMDAFDRVARREIGAGGVAPETSPRPTIGAAVIDVRGFTDYNGAFGHELGDRLIQDLARCLTSEVVAGVEAGFLAHLGEDRFMVLGESDGLERSLRHFIERCNQGRGFSTRSLGLCTEPPDPERAEGDIAGTVRPGPGTYPGCGLRAVFVPRVTERVREPRELYTLFRQLRRAEPTLDATKPLWQSYMIHDRRGARERRRSA